MRNLHSHIKGFWKLQDVFIFFIPPGHFCMNVIKFNHKRKSKPQNCYKKWGSISWKKLQKAFLHWSYIDIEYICLAWIFTKIPLLTWSDPWPFVGQNVAWSATWSSDGSVKLQSQWPKHVHGWYDEVKDFSREEASHFKYGFVTDIDICLFTGHFMWHWCWVMIFVPPVLFQWWSARTTADRSLHASCLGFDVQNWLRSCVLPLQYQNMSATMDLG